MIITNTDAYLDIFSSKPETKVVAGQDIVTIIQ